MLLARSGNTVGKAYLHKASFVNYSCFFAGYLIRFVINDELVSPDYVFYYTQTKFYQDWVRGIKRTAGQPNINAEEYRALLIPIPPANVQNRIIETFRNAYLKQDEKVAEARIKLDSVHPLVLDTLGIKLPEKDDGSLANRSFYTKSVRVTGNRFDPDALHSERINAVKAIELSKFPAEHLRHVAEFVRDGTSENPGSLPYIGLVDIESNTGIYKSSGEVEEFVSANIFTSGDVLFPKLRPYLNKVFLAPFDGICSTEFHVLRGKLVSNRFLAAFLRNEIVVRQTKRLMTGNTLPRLQTSDIESLLIPIPPIELQDEIADHVDTIYDEAKRLREEGDKILAEAKAQVEKMILGESSAA